MIQEAKYFTESIEENINRLTDEVASNTSKWFDQLKDQFCRMDYAQFTRTVTSILEMTIGVEVESWRLNHQILDKILKGFVELAKAFVDATSTAAYKWTAKRVAKYIKYLWESLDQEAKAIIGFAFFAGNEIIETIVLPNIAQK